MTIEMNDYHPNIWMILKILYKIQPVSNLTVIKNLCLMVEYNKKAARVAALYYSDNSFLHGIIHVFCDIITFHILDVQLGDAVGKHGHAEGTRG